MAFLLPASAKQAALRFAISKIGIIDDTAIDLDKFSFAWGRKSTITLPKVPLKAQKLTSYLPLPPNFQVSEAYVNDLRISIPANLQGITVDATGIVAKGRIAQGSEEDVPHGKGGATDKLDQETIPTAEDLAKSFVQDESAEERRRLEAAIRSQSQYLQQDPFTESSVFSDDGYDESELGTGVGLSTPYYVSNYLKLVMDTSKVSIGDIELQIETELPPEDWDDDEAVQAGLVVHIGGIEVDGLTTVTQEEAASAHEEQARHGKRRIALKGLSAGLLLDEKNMAKSRIASSFAASPTGSGSVPSDSFHPPSVSSPIARRSPLVQSRSPSTDAGSSPSPQSSRHLPAMSESVMTTDADRFADAEDETETSHVSGMAASVDSQRFGQQSLYGDESILQFGMDNGMFDSNVEDSQSPEQSHRSPASPEHLINFEHSAETEQSPQAVFSGSSSLPGRLPHVHEQIGADDGTHSVSRSQPMPENSPLEPGTASHDSAVSGAGSPSPEATSASDQSSSASPSPASSEQGDLAESRLFSHEDAESMYMSAIDDGTAQSSRSFHMPGAWDTSSVSSNDSDRIYHPPVSATATALDSIAEKDDGCETPRPGSRLDVETGVETDHSLHQNEVDLRTKVFVPLVDIDIVSVWVPFEKSSQETPGSDPLAYHDDQPRSRVAFAEDSVFHDVPGAFSQYAASTARSRPSASIMRDSRRLPAHQQQQSSSNAESEREGSTRTAEDEVEVSVGNVRAQVDVETIYLAMRLVKMIQQLFGDSSSVDNKKDSKNDSKKIKEEPSSKTPWSFKFSMENMQLSLLKELFTQSIAPNKLVGGLRHAEWDFNEVLLILRASGINATGTNKNGSLSASLKVGVFSFGFSDRGILSFQSGTGLEETTMDVNKPIEHDISITYTGDNGGPRIDISTLPINISLDVQKLDDTFASYGGFSGVLKISNHIKSTCVLPPPAPKVSPMPKTHMPEEVPFPKIDARFAALNFNLQGETCGVLLETSTVRTNVRKGGIRVNTKHAKISGPHLMDSALLRSNPPLLVEVHDIRIVYAFVPEEVDLSDLLSLITPTAFKYEADDDILIDTLLSQRRKGSFVKVRVQGSMHLDISDLEGIKQLDALGKDVAKLSSVAKLLPDDERPGILSMIEVANCKVAVVVDNRIGRVTLNCLEVRVAHIGLPALLALSVHSIEAARNDSEWFLTEVTNDRDAAIPMIMARWLGDEMEPILKVKLYNLLFDYRVTTIMALLGLSEDCTADDVAFGMASSIATIKKPPSPGIIRQSSSASEKSSPPSRPMNLDLLLRDCAIGLNPHKSQAKALLVLSDTRFTGSLVQDVVTTASLDIRRASLLVVDEVDRLDPDRPQSSSSSLTGLGTAQVNSLCRWGFVTVGTVSKAKAVVKISESHKDGHQSVDVEFKNDLFVMESCADSTQTLIAIFGGLAPPQPPSKEVQYRTKVEPVVDMMASLVGEDFKAPPKDEQLHMDQSIVIDDDDQDIHFTGSIYDPGHLPNLDEMTEESIEESMLKSQQQLGNQEPLEELNFKEDFFSAPSEEPPAAQAWDSRKNEYIESSEVSVAKSPLTIRVKNIHFIWNLYDGYDWPRTRDKLNQKLEEVEQRAQERRERDLNDGFEGVSFEEDLLFGSVYITLPVNNTPEENRRQLNQALRGGDDAASETSFATTTASRAAARPHRKRLRLERGRHHKIKFELSGVSADVVVFPPGHGETQNSVDVRVENLDVIDHVPTSTWNKFVTYDKAAGERPLGSPMIRLEMLTVRPVPTLAASELVIRVSVLPLRLHVDQDALDFITRFFEFKDDRITSKDAPGDQPFIQRLEVRTVKLNLDYKPKKVDYAGLRSGHTTEFMNFFILEKAHITLRRCIVYGISGFDKVHKTLNGIWMPDVQRNQIPKILTGLAVTQQAAEVGKAVMDIVSVPFAEYKKDGRIFRSAQKGALAFAKNTTTELLRLGGKVSIGTQAMIQTAEGILSPVSPSAGSSHTQQDDTAWHDVPSPGSSPADEPRAISNYADQPIGVRAGLISARRHLQQDFLSARDAIIAIPGEVMDSGSATGAAKAVVRRAPVVILRPFTGVAKAAGATMFGAANALDPESKRKIDDKYKHH
ncbi:Autophagy-related protein [Macrophomina phaseolina MS6]|uniref:Autophagy-related protein 2 n=1 Tax=Macrophomina phaseolina (strain MS6) TaxID=1126212 RepID=K2S735_MACPH|nr:Autophagy-related protein [Macrophomina phaseolina MS6]